MEGMQTQGKTLRYIAVYPDEYQQETDYPLIILLHGFGASMSDLVNLCPAIDRHGYVYACPNAPIDIQTAPDTVGYAWELPATFFESQPRPEGLPESEPLLEVFIAEVMERFRVRPGQTILGGFSQGGGLTYRIGLPRPNLFAGLVVMSSGLRDLDAIRSKLPARRDQPIFISHGLSDNPERARQATEFLEAEGYKPQYREYPMGHEISQEVISDLVPWIHKVLPPRPLLYMP
ncbi:MAG: hypothetical protein EXR50_06670 [Dehalococcoidia bacterium]|nr:hypothetical protein [Dehalococcoidia bacterium]